MRLIKYIILLVILVCVVSTAVIITHVPVGDYFYSDNPILIRIKSELPVILKCFSQYLLFILILLIAYVFLEKNKSSFCCKLINKLEIFDTHSIQSNKFLTGIDRKTLIYLCLYSIAVVAVRNWSSVLNGYFKYDDFEFFSTNRTESLLTLFVTPHGDHLLPLYRLEIAVMNFLFGVNPLYYNLLVSLLFVMLVVFAGLLLREFGASSFTSVLFSFFLICWVNWGEMVAGYFCISIYVQIALLSLISIWSYFRWVKTLSIFYPILCVVCIGSALFLDFSGVWVPLGVLVFSLETFFSANPRPTITNWFKSHRWLLMATAVLYFSFAVLNLLAFSVDKHGVFLSMSGHLKHTILSFLSQLFYTISGGLLLTPLFPIGYNLFPKVLLLVLLTTLIVSAGLVVSDAVQNSQTKVKWHLISVLIIICMTVSLVVIGRPMAGFDYVLPTKYIGVPFIWFCILNCLIWDHYWQKAELAGRKKMATATVILLLFFIGHQLFFDSLLYAYQAEIVGYRTNVADAKIRKKSVNEIRQRLILPLFESKSNDLHIPALDGKYIYNAYPKLWSYNLSHYIDFLVPEGKKVVLNRNNAMQSWTAKDVVCVDSLRSNTDVRFIQLLENDAYVQRMYLSPVELNTNTSLVTSVKSDSINPGQFVNTSSLLVQPDGGMLFVSDGSAEMVINKGDWDPEEKHLLVLNVAYKEKFKKDKVKLEVQFTGELNIPYRKNYFVITSGKQSILSIDMLQIYSYSLNPRVGSLRISFPIPGTYVVSSVLLK